MRSLLSLLLLPALLAFAPAPAQAVDEQTCLDRAEMVTTLLDKYGEQLAEVHEIKGEGLIEFHVSPDNGNWTVLLTKAGTSCVLAAGTGMKADNYAFLDPGLEI